MAVALGAMIAVRYDLVLTIGFMSLTQIDFDLTSIAALSQLGGSHDTARPFMTVFGKSSAVIKKKPMADI